MKPSELVQAAIKGSGVTTPYELWKLTGVPQPRLSEFKSDSAWPSNTHAKSLADAAGLPWAEVIAELEMSKAKDEQTRTAWGKALTSLRSKAALILVCIFVTAAVLPIGTQVGLYSLMLSILALSIIFIM